MLVCCLCYMTKTCCCSGRWWKKTCHKSQTLASAAIIETGIYIAYLVLQCCVCWWDQRYTTYTSDWLHPMSSCHMTSDSNHQQTWKSWKDSRYLVLVLLTKENTKIFKKILRPIQLYGNVFPACGSEWSNEWMLDEYWY